jgi:hypothetical protein
MYPARGGKSRLHQELTSEATATHMEATTSKRFCTRKGQIFTLQPVLVNEVLERMCKQPNIEPLRPVERIDTSGIINDQLDCTAIIIRQIQFS